LAELPQQPPIAEPCERLRAYGLFSEIISWKLRFFVPVGAAGSRIIGRLVERFPIERIAEREAA